MACYMQKLTRPITTSSGSISSPIHKMKNVSTTTKGVHKKLFSDISQTDAQSLKKRSWI